MLENVDKYTGRQVQKYREELGMMQAELAAALRDQGVNWSQATLSKVERGERPVRLSEAPTVAKALGRSLSDLLPGGVALATVKSRVEWAYRKAEDDVRWAKAHLTWALNSLKTFRLLERLAAGDTGTFAVNVGKNAFLNGANSVEMPISMSTEELLSLVGVSLDAIEAAKEEAKIAHQLWVDGGEGPRWFEDLTNSLPRTHSFFEKEFVTQKLLDLFCETFPNVTFTDYEVGDAFQSEDFDIEADEKSILIDGLPEVDLPETFTKLINKSQSED